MRKSLEKLSAFVAVALLAVVVLACKKGEGNHCLFNKDCKDELVCIDATCKTLADAKKDCRASSACTMGGACNISSVAGEEVAVCAAKTDDDCKDSKNCKENKMCRAVNLSCVE